MGFFGFLTELKVTVQTVRLTQYAEHIVMDIHGIGKITAGHAA